jgi:hypothetical protein
MDLTRGLSTTSSLFEATPTCARRWNGSKSLINGHQVAELNKLCHNRGTGKQKKERLAHHDLPTNISVQMWGLKVEK